MLRFVADKKKTAAVALRAADGAAIALIVNYRSRAGFWAVEKESS